MYSIQHTSNNTHSVRFKEDIRCNFNLSIVIPFYKKMKEFRRVFPLNRQYFERNGIEVILVLDCPDEKEELLEYIKGYPFVNWKVIYNEQPHEWRNPAKPINVGIKNASKDYIMVCSPESEFYSDAIYILRKALDNYPDHFAIGRVCFTENNNPISNGDLDKLRFIPFGSIMVKKEYLYQIKGYDETLIKWGGDDNNIRSRLEFIGIKKLFIPEAILLHRDIDNEAGKKRREYRHKDIPNDAFRHFFYPPKSIANEGVWGEDFNNIIYDWQHNQYAEKLLITYLQEFKRACLNDHTVSQSYKTLLLVQSYNEKERISGFLKLVEPYFDGIILLDDNSTDGTYECAYSSKLLLKVQKERKGFNDLLNRNLLLKLASFFNYQWGCFLDVDESLDPRYANIQNIIKDTDADSFIFNLIQLWDTEETYNLDYPSTFEGISLKYRMFKNMGHAQIISNRGKLHFKPIPYCGKAKHVPILIKHYGNLTQDLRKQKYLFYQKEDIEHSQSSYEHLLNETPRLKRVSETCKEDLIKAINLISSNIK